MPSPIRCEVATLPATLTGTARRLAELLDAEAGSHPECWRGNAWLARALAVCERTIRNALAELAGCGLIAALRDYSLSTRRRIRLLWQRVTCDTFVAATISNNSVAVMDGSPDPYIGIERVSIEDDDDLDAGAYATPPGEAPRQSSSSQFHSLRSHDPRPVGQSVGRALDRLTTPQPPGKSSSSLMDDEGEPRRPATKAEVAAVVSRARKLFPHVPALGWKIRSLAKSPRCDGLPVGIGWIDQALVWAEYRGATRWAFVVKVIGEWRETGPSGPPVPRRTTMQNLNPPAPKEESRPVGVEDIEPLRALASRPGPHGDWARRRLTELGAA